MTAIRSSAIGNAASGNPSVAEPTGAAVGDKILVILTSNGNAGNTDNNGSTPFTLKDFHDETIDGIRVEVFERYKQSGDPSTYNFTAGASGRWSAVSVALSNPHPSNVWDVVPTFNEGTSTTAGSAPSITTLTANAIHFAVFGTDGVSNVATATPAGYTVLQNGGDESQAVTYKVIATAGATGAQSFTYTNPDGNIGLSFAIIDYTPPAATSANSIIARIIRRIGN